MLRWSQRACWYWSASWVTASSPSAWRSRWPTTCTWSHPSVDPRRAQHSGAITSARVDVVAVDGSAGLVAVYQGDDRPEKQSAVASSGLALPPPSRWPSFAPTFV